MCHQKRNDEAIHQRIIAAKRLVVRFAAITVFMSLIWSAVL